MAHWEQERLATGSFFWFFGERRLRIGSLKRELVGSRAGVSGRRFNGMEINQATTEAPSVDRHWILEAVDRFEGPLILYATRLLGDGERARDVVQDTFLKLCKQPRLAVQDRLGEWLFTVCRNRALDVLRKEKRMNSLSEEKASTCTSSELDPALALAERDDAQQAMQLLDGLPANQQEVIRLKFQHGFSYREISQISGHSVTNVGFLIHSGMKTLRQRMVGGFAAEC